MSRLPFRAIGSRRKRISEGLNCVRFLFNLATSKIGPLSHLNDFHVFPRNNIRKTFTVMHYPVFEHEDTHSFAFLGYIIFYIDGGQFRCRGFTFAKYIYMRKQQMLDNFSALFCTCFCIHAVRFSFCLFIYLFFRNFLFWITFIIQNYI